MKRTLAIGLCAAALASLAHADRYWVAYEGDDYPENEGWERLNFGDGPANRTLENGVLTIDSLWSMNISDFYRLERPLNPGSGETFVMEWRLRVNEVVDNGPRLVDPSIGLFSDDDWGLGFEFGVDSLRSVFEDDVTYLFDPGHFHEYRASSADMRTYELFMDNELIHDGLFWEPASTSSRVAWGDGIQGAASSADWDYFRFGVIPEPASGLLAAMMVVMYKGRYRHVSRSYDSDCRRSQYSVHF